MSSPSDTPSSIRTPSRRLGIASLLDLSICISLPSSSIPPHRSRTLTLAEEIVSGLPSDDTAPERDQSWHVCVMDQAIEIVDSDDAFNMASANAYTLLQLPNTRNTYALRVVTDSNHTFAASEKDNERYLSVAATSTETHTQTQTSASSTDTDDTSTNTHTSTSKHDDDDDDDEPSTSRVRFQIEDKKPTTTTSTSTSPLSLDPNQRLLSLCTTSTPDSSELFSIAQVAGLSRCRITCPAHDLIWTHSQGRVILVPIDDVASDDPSTHFTLSLHTTTQASYAAARERALSMIPTAQQAEARQIKGIKRLDALFASLKAT